MIFMTLGGANSTAADIPRETLSTILETVVPEVYSQTAASSEIALSNTSRSVEISDVGTGHENSDVSIQIPSTSIVAKSEDGLSYIGASSADSQQVVQPLDEGFRILNISKNENSPTEFSYILNLPAGATAEMNMGTVRVTRGDEILGSIKEPWAVDASGKQIETYFTLEGNTLTQHVKINSSANFPIISDPNWGYVATYALTTSHVVSWERLHNCFNCYFPVDGAPSKWPAFGQRLPLTVTQLGIVSNMECTMNYILTSTTYYKWKFLATKNHIDGLGSNIIFELRKTSTGKYQLVVDAWIVNDFWGGNLTYEILAKSNWQTFADNLNRF